MQELIGRVSFSFENMFAKLSKYARGGGQYIRQWDVLLPGGAIPRPDGGFALPFPEEARGRQSSEL